MSKRSNENSDIICNKLKALRIAKGLTQEKLGELLGLTFQQIQKYEIGSNRISLNRAITMCEKLGIGLNYFDDKSIDIYSPEDVKILNAVNALKPEEKSLILRMLKNADTNK